jgi:regulator of cell morphogenesis and NO signaling
MTGFNVDTTVGQLVSESPARARVFEQLGIDYCCGGKRPLAAVCAEKGLAVDSVVARLAAAAQGSSGEADWTRRSMTALADHIEATHHTYLKSELPRLSARVQKVVNAHGTRHPELAQVQQVFEQLRDELTSHMMKEERILFPAIRAIEAGDGAAASHCGSIRNPIHVMESEHDGAGDALARLRTLTSDYVVPEGACNTYLATLHALEELERDMHQHVHKENNILFPRAIAAEEKACQA